MVDGRVVKGFEGCLRRWEATIVVEDSIGERDFFSFKFIVEWAAVCICASSVVRLAHYVVCFAVRKRTWINR
jgi:hypothetical protein